VREQVQRGSGAVEQCNEPDEVVANGLSPSQVIAVFYAPSGIAPVAAA
jgi:hypothetical protein